MVALESYTESRKEEWDSFIDLARNGMFLFRRDYMEYHRDRYVDASLLFFDDSELVAVMPASIDGATMVSHEGLTFGGIVSGSRMRAKTMLEVVGALRSHLGVTGVTTLTYKRIPYIYCGTPCDEDLYALFRNDARLVRCDISAAVRLSNRLPYTKGRKWAVNKSRKSAIQLQESDQIEAFMELETEHLQSRFGTRPVHTPAEMRLLVRRFPRNIRLFAAALGNRMVAGILVYESRNVAHAQYIVTTEEGRDACALDALVDFLLGDVFASKRYFDFGTSNGQAGRYLNEGLIDNKESYGARGIAHEFFELTAGDQ